MTWPTVAVTTTNTDGSGDSPATARTDILDLMTKANQMIAHVSAFAATVLDDTTASAARTTLGAAASGANTDITSLGAVTGVTATLLDDSTKLASTEFVRNFRQLAQVVTYQTGAVATGITLIPYDDTIPQQSTEGDQYMSLAITPKDAGSTLEIDVEWVGCSSVANNMTVALFQDGTANALAAVQGFIFNATALTPISLKHVMTSGTTSATTFKVKAGGYVAGTTTFNGVGGARYFGGLIASRITIKEYLP